MIGQDARLLPVAAAAWAGAWLGSSGAEFEVVVPVLLVVTGIGWWALARRRRLLSLLVLVVVLVAAPAWLRARQHTWGPVAELAREGAAMTVEVAVASEPLIVQRNGRPVAVARGEARAVTSRGRSFAAQQSIVIFGAGEVAADLAQLEPGASYAVTGIAREPQPGSSAAIALSARQLSGQRSPPGWWDRLINQLRAGLIEATGWCSPEQAALLPSLVVGDTARIDEATAERFRVTSLSHLLAVSGANLTLLLSVVLPLAKLLGVRGWSIRVLAVGVVAFFVFICRFEPSVVRAAAMGLVALSAVGSTSGKNSLRHLSVAVFGLLLLDPWLSQSVGFALSVCACLGIVLLAPAWVAALSRWAPRWLAEAIAVTLAAQLATQPLITAISGRVSLVGVFANLAAGPFVGPATVLGLAAMCLSWWPPAALAVGWLGGWCVQPILWVAQFGAGLPLAALSWPSSPFGIAASAAMAASVALAAGWALRRRGRSLAVAVLLVLVAAVRVPALSWAGDWDVAFCDVGQGDAAVLNAGGGAVVLVDTGPEAQPTLDCLGQLGVQQVPVIILTHFHADHIGGIAEVTARFRPELIVVSALASPADGAEDVQRVGQSIGVTPRPSSPGERIELGRVSWVTISSAPSGASAEPLSSQENNASVIGIATVGELRLVFPGDAEPAAQRRAMATAETLGIELAADVLKVPHHGSARQVPEFFAATGAQLAVVSCGVDNDYGHPAANTTRLVAQQEMQLVRTDQQGTILLHAAAGNLQIRAEREPEP